VILHVDMDAFYASVEERDRPGLVGRPVIVGGTPAARGVVAAANYVVRRFGVHSAMSTAEAMRRCPQAVVIPPRTGHYAEVSRCIREILERFTPLVEPLSLDEAFLDVAGCEALFGPAAEIARQIKAAIRAETRLVASVGVAPNKFLAKIASDLHKPDALVVVDPGRVAEFLDPLPVCRLWGVGKVAEGVLGRLGIRTIGDLRRRPVELLVRTFGQSGRHLWDLAHGIDDRPVVPDREAKSVSHETTFPVDVADRDTLRAWLLELTEQVARRLRRHDLQGRTVQLKVRFDDFTTITRSQTLPGPTSATARLWDAAAVLLDRLPPAHRPVRLVGIGVSGLDRSDTGQRSLFDGPEQRKQSDLDAALDRIRETFGSDALQRGSRVRHGGRHVPGPHPDDV
jgi:DNA polymerase-4